MFTYIICIYEYVHLFPSCHLKMLAFSVRSCHCCDNARSSFKWQQKQQANTYICTYIESFVICTLQWHPSAQHIPTHTHTHKRYQRRNCLKKLKKKSKKKLNKNEQKKCDKRKWQIISTFLVCYHNQQTCYNDVRQADKPATGDQQMASGKWHFNALPNCSRRFTAKGTTTNKQFTIT